MEAILDLYTDYLLSSLGRTTATGLSSLLDGSLFHDKISCLLSGNAFTSKDLWGQVKPLVRSPETDDACLINLWLLLKPPGMNFIILNTR